MGGTRRRKYIDENQRLSPVFHAMENYGPSFPRYGKLLSTVWKIWDRATASAKPGYKRRSPIPDTILKWKKASNNGVLATAHKLPLCTPSRTLHTYPVQPVGRSRPLTFGEIYEKNYPSPSVADSYYRMLCPHREWGL